MQTHSSDDDNDFEKNRMANVVMKNAMQSMSMRTGRFESTVEDCPGSKTACYSKVGVGIVSPV